jgi:chromatin structure-remodeling complex subunit RSC1/2
VNPISYNNYQTASPNPRPVQQSTTSHNTHSNAYNPPRTIEVYTLPDSAVSSIPADIRSQFHRDEAGRVIFYTTPPLDVNAIQEGAQALGHSLRYLADKTRGKEADEKKRKAYVIQLESEASDRLKRMRADDDGKQHWIRDQKLKALQKWCRDMNKSTNELYQQMHGNEWKEIREKDLCRLAIGQEEASKKQKEITKYQKQRMEEKNVKITGFKWV